MTRTVILQCAVFHSNEKDTHVGFWGYLDTCNDLTASPGLDLFQASFMTCARRNLHGFVPFCITFG